MARWLNIDLPPTAKAAEYLHLTIKHEQNKELLVYPVLMGSRAAGITVKRLPLTEGSQIVGVIHRGILLHDIDQRKLICDDQVIILATNSARDVLGRVFAPPAPSSFHEGDGFFGEFALHPEAKLSEIAQAYGFDVDARNAELTVKDYLVKKFHGKPVVGDYAKLGPVKLIVRKIKGSNIESVGLKLRQK